MRYDCSGDGGDGKTQGDGKSKNSDDNSPSSDGNLIVVGGRKIEIYTASFRDVLKQCEAKLRRKMAERKCGL